MWSVLNSEAEWRATGATTPPVGFPCLYAEVNGTDAYIYFDGGRAQYGTADFKAAIWEGLFAEYKAASTLEQAARAIPAEIRDPALTAAIEAIDANREDLISVPVDIGDVLPGL